MEFLKKLFGGNGGNRGNFENSETAAFEAEFVPGNDLEQLLIALQQGTAQRAELPFVLAKSRLFMLFFGDPENVMEKETTQPLAIRGEQGFFGICVFSASERAMELQAQHPEFRTGIETEFGWILDICPPGVGILINPGTPYTVELHPDGVAPIREGVKNGEYD